MPKKADSPKQSDLKKEQRLLFLSDKSRHNTRRILFFSLFCAYAFLAVLGTTDYDILLKKPIEIPGLRVTLPLLSFYLVVPAVIVVLHYGILWMHRYSQRELQQVSPETIKAIPFSILDSVHIEKNLLLKITINYIIYLFPLSVLLAFLIIFADYQSISISIYHAICFLLDLWLIYFLVSSFQRKWLKFLSVFVTCLILVILGSYIYFLNNPYLLLKIKDNNEWPLLEKNPIMKKMKSLYYYFPHLEVTHINLNEGFNVDEAKSYQELETNKEKKPLLFYITKTNLRDRKLILANLSNSKMVNFDFRGSELIGANLQSSSLQYSLLTKTNLQWAYLRSANLEGADLMSANLQGADLGGANLEGADLISANLQGADLRFAHLQGAWLYKAHLEGADLGGAHLQGAYLALANLQGADLMSAHLQGADLRKAHLQGASLRDANLNGVSSFDGLSQEKFSKKDFLKIEAFIKNYSIFPLPGEIETKRLNLLKQAIGKTSREWLNMQKGKYSAGVLTWEEACKIQKEVTYPKARKNMGLDKINWEEKCANFESKDSP